MKFTPKMLLISLLALLIIPVMFFTGCGKNESAPDKSTITINPATATLANILADTIETFTVTVRYEDGTPMPYAKIHISGAFAAPAAGANYQFYYYPDGTQNPNGNVTVDSGFEAQTDRFGVYTFSVVVFGPGSTFTDNIYVTSGTANGLATLALSVS